MFWKEEEGENKRKREWTEYEGKRHAGNYTKRRTKHKIAFSEGKKNSKQKTLRG